MTFIRLRGPDCTAMRRTRWLAFGLAACLLTAGCEVARERVYLPVRSGSVSENLELAPTQRELTDALLAFASDRGFRCRQHVKRWDEYACNGPHDMRITFEPDRGKGRFVAEFTLVYRSTQEAADLDLTVDEFVRHMNARFLVRVERKS